MAFLLSGLKDMIAGSSTPGRAQLPKGVRQLNSSVYELYCPIGDYEAEIIFFHGLQIGHFENAYWETWRSLDDKNSDKKVVVWPQEWLSKKFPTSRILSVSYNSSALNSNGQPDLYSLGENLVHDIILDPDANISQRCPVILVAHSLGGIVIKNFVLSAKKQQNFFAKDGIHQASTDRIDNFFKNFRGVFYYATPHGGAQIANRVKELASLIDASPILSLLETLDSVRANINSDFQVIQRRYGLRTFTVAEGRQTSYLGFNGWVVEDVSAGEGVDHHYTHTDADHFTVCKAKNVNDPTVIGLLATFIRSSVQTITYVDVQDQGSTIV